MTGDRLRPESADRRRALQGMVAEGSHGALTGPRDGPRGRGRPGLCSRAKARRFARLSSCGRPVRTPARSWSRMTVAAAPSCGPVRSGRRVIVVAIPRLRFAPTEGTTPVPPPAHGEAPNGANRDQLMRPARGSTAGPNTRVPGAELQVQTGQARQSVTWMEPIADPLGPPDRVAYSPLCFGSRCHRPGSPGSMRFFAEPSCYEHRPGAR